MSQHFRVCYDPAVPPNFRPEDLLTALEDAWSYLAAEYSMPVPWNNGKISVWIQQPGQFLVCDQPQPIERLIPDIFVRDPQTPAVSLPGRIWVRTNNNLADLHSTAVHELFHQIQWYDAGFRPRPQCVGILPPDDLLRAYTIYYQNNGWWMEASAQWMEFYMSDLHGYSDPGYWAYLRDYLDNPAAGLKGGVTVQNGASHRVYGEAIFAQYLAEELKDPGIIKQSWVGASAPGSIFNTRDIADSIDQAMSNRLNQVFRDYAPSLYEDFSWQVYGHRGQWGNVRSILKPDHLHDLAWSGGKNKTDKVTGDIEALGAEYILATITEDVASTKLKLNFQGESYGPAVEEKVAIIGFRRKSGASAWTPLNPIKVNGSFWGNRVTVDDVIADNLSKGEQLLLVIANSNWDDKCGSSNCNNPMLHYTYYYRSA
jgi:hypothetical protein